MWAGIDYGERPATEVVTGDYDIVAYAYTISNNEKSMRYPLVQPRSNIEGGWTMWVLQGNGSERNPLMICQIWISVV